MKQRLIIFFCCITALSACSNSEKQHATAFNKLNELGWSCVFSDDCCEDWTQSWFKDGEVAHVVNDENGMMVAAGPKHFCDSDHVVLWTKKEFTGDVKIEYDFMRLDTINNFVNILYFLAQGSGKSPYVSDIAAWSDLRVQPAMNLYFDHMNTYHISYAVSGGTGSGGSEYIRARRYIPETEKGLQGTALQPEYSGRDLFKVGQLYHIVVIKKAQKIYMNVSSSEVNRTFYFDASTLPNIEKGRVGLRQMHGRISRYSNFKIYQQQEF